MNVKVGLLTPVGEGGISVILVVGDGAAGFVSARLRTPGGAQASLLPGKLAYGFFHDVAGERLDEVIAACVDESRIELNCHGGAVPVHRVLESLAADGACAMDRDETLTLASEGDMVKREAAAALEMAATDLAARVFAAQFGGALRRAADEARGALSGGSAGVERAKSILHELAESSQTGLALACRRVVAVLGPPNAGKSTLVNALAGFERNIVSPIAGTTRDAVEVPVSLFGVPATLVDTAGAGRAASALDAEAQDRRRRAFAFSDAVIVVIDGSAPLPADFKPSLPLERAVVVSNKSDLGINEASVTVAASWGRRFVSTSATMGAGIKDLSRAILAVLRVPLPDNKLATRAVIFTERQYGCVSRALERAEAGDIRQAAAALGEL